MIKHSLSFDGNSFAFLALAGIIFKLFIGNSVSDNGVTGPASSTIWGYGLVTISLLMVLFINVAIVSRMSTLKESNIASIKLTEYNGFTLDSKDGNILKFKNKVMSDLEIIDAVEEVRKGNNTNWMDLVRLAFEVAPEKARPIFAKINDGDGNISQLLDQLAKNG